MNPQTPAVQVGILSGTRIEFILTTPYRMQGIRICGKQVATYRQGAVCWNGQQYTELLFVPEEPGSAVFELEAVTIGIGFHWEQQESQRFRGSLKLIATEEGITAINIVNVEEYLTSVISSEMSATASLELLKAHAVISRSWLLAQIERNRQRKERTVSLQTCIKPQAKHTAASGDDKEHGKEYIRWYDHQDHSRFDVCADDHCQRYQGITRASTDRVRQAIAETYGQVLMYDGHICDARFSKCCGGALEEFQYCWENIRHPYLVRQRDWKRTTGTPQLPDLTVETEAERWIRSTPDAFCHTTDSHILSQVLNRYDQKTTDFYRWQVSYTQAALSALLHERSGIDFGQIIDLVPVSRGTSGRLWRLRIVGTRQTLTIGKELEIRRVLSRSHLYSSAFVVDREEVSPEGIPARFTLTGAGWGHGVGLCQIGAAVMGEQGYSYDAILLHYYTGARIEQLYQPTFLP